MKRKKWSAVSTGAPTIRSFSAVNLLVIDEAARVPDELYSAVRPMLAVSKGRLIALGTPFGKRGWFYQEWEGKNNWERVKITALQCPRISKETLEEERLALGERWFRQDFFCSFEDMIGAVFDSETINKMFTDTPYRPLWDEPQPVVTQESTEPYRPLLFEEATEAPKPVADVRTNPFKPAELEPNKLGIRIDAEAPGWVRAQHCCVGRLSSRGTNKPG